MKIMKHSSKPLSILNPLGKSDDVQSHPHTKPLDLPPFDEPTKLPRTRRRTLCYRIEKQPKPEPVWLQTSPTPHAKKYKPFTEWNPRRLLSAGMKKDSLNAKRDPPSIKLVIPPMDFIPLEDHEDLLRAMFRYPVDHGYL